MSVQDKYESTSQKTVGDKSVRQSFIKRVTDTGRYTAKILRVKVKSFYESNISLPSP